MVTVKEKITVTQRIRGNCPTHSRTEISVRDVRTVIDEPKEREGTNMGPTPTETMVAALIACTNVISHKCAKKHGVELKAMTVNAESTLDRRGTQLLEEIEVPFPKIRLLIDVTTDASEAAGEGKDRSSPLLPDFQGDPQFGHRARGGLERYASLNAQSATDRISRSAAPLNEVQNAILSLAARRCDD